MQRVIRQGRFFRFSIVLDPYTKSILFSLWIHYTWAIIIDDNCNQDSDEPMPNWQESFEGDRPSCANQSGSLIVDPSISSTELNKTAFSFETSELNRVMIDEFFFFSIFFYIFLLFLFCCRFVVVCFVGLFFKPAKNWKNQTCQLDGRVPACVHYPFQVD